MSGTTTWDPNQKSANITLSGSNLVATFTSTTLGGVRGTRTSDGPVYDEHTVTLVGTTYRLGLANYVFNGGSVSLGADTNGVGINATDGTVKINNVNIGTVAAFTTADTVDMSYHPQLHLIWFRINNGNWNNVPGAAPASATVADAQSGFDTSTLATGGGGPLFPAFTSSGTNSAAVTSKFSTAFTRTAPTGFSSLDANQGTGVGVAPNSNPVHVGPARTDADGNYTVHTVFQTAAGGFYGLAANVPNTAEKQWSPAATVTHASGVVTINGAFAAKKVRLYDQATGDLLGETTSLLADGTWTIPALGRTSVYAVCLDDTGTFDAMVFDLVAPV